MKNYLRRKFLNWFFAFMRNRLHGKHVFHMVRLDGQPLYQSEGYVVGGVINRDLDHVPTGLTLFMSQNDHSIRDMKRFSVFSLEYDRRMGWVFYD